MTSTALEARRPGRPRSTQADEAILVAAIEIFAEVGFEGLTVEGVAARAGVGKATIYRRYPGKSRPRGRRRSLLHPTPSGAAGHRHDPR
jgi:AcrR family transcriptional regulator